MSLYAGLDRAHGVYVVAKQQSDGAKVAGRALTESKPVTPEVWASHLDGKKGLGIIPLRDDGTVMWAGIDIDTYPTDHAAIEAKLTELQLPLVVIKSKSGGAHLMLFMADPLPAKYVRAKLHEWAVAIGYPGVEVFPKQNEHRDKSDIGNWLNMPYFGGDDSPRHAVYDGKPLNMVQFLKLAEGRRVSKAALDSFVIGGGEAFENGPPCLQHLAKNGFPRGTRNKGLFNLGVFARMAHGDDWQNKVDEMNRQFMSPPLSSAEVSTTVKSLARKNYFYSCSQDPIASVCQKEICKTRKFGIGEGHVNATPALIGAITKIASDPPVYIMDVEGVRIECSADDILSQPRFRKLVFERSNKLVPLLKPQLWDSMINEKMATLETVEAPRDAGPEGQFLTHLDNFCTSRVTANSVDEMLLGKPYVDADNGRTYFRSIDLLRYLEQVHFRELNERKIWAILMRAGAQHHNMLLKGKRVLTWSIASHQRQTEDFDVPKVEGSEL